VRVLDAQGDPVVGEVPAFTVMAGGWAGGANRQATRACTTDGLGICSPGQMDAGSVVRVTLPGDKAAAVEITAVGSGG